MLIQEKPGYPGDLGKPFDGEECIRIARKLSECGHPPGVLNITALSSEMHRDCGRLERVLIDAGWFETLECPGLFFPPERRKAMT